MNQTQREFYAAVLAADLYDGVFVVPDSFRGELRQQVSLIEHAERKECPLEYVMLITITDERGLAQILERTARAENLEWATLTTAQASGEVAQVTDIFDPYRAETEGIVTVREPEHVVIGLRHAPPHTGFLHFHVPTTGANYHVHDRDRFAGRIRGMHILTFNTPQGPEMIGFNKRFTYLPEDDAKRRLVHATPAEIMGYLGKF